MWIVCALTLNGQENLQKGAPNLSTVLTTVSHVEVGVEGKKYKEGFHFLLHIQQHYFDFFKQ